MRVISSPICNGKNKMDGNKDEAEKCISIAKRCISAGDKEKALKFLNKAQRLFSSKTAEDLINQLGNSSQNGSASAGDGPDSQPSSGAAPGGANAQGDGVRQRRGSGSRADSDAKAKPESKRAEYTTEQLESVRRVKKCKDYYEILSVDKEASDSDLKKAYRKLALQMHPDKNKAPGATDAFKAIGNAFAVLSNADKRKRYDTYGTETDDRRSYDSDYTHGGFEGDISAEELFNMFFGGGFPSNNVYAHRSRRHQQQQQHFFQRETTNESTSTLLLQLSPILLLVLLSILSSFFVSDPAFSMHRTSKYSTERKTSNLRIPFYVKEDFHIEYKGNLRRIERQVEDEYVSNLRSNCFRERTYKENMVWRARNYGDADLYNRAMNMKTPSCDQLQSVYG